MIGILTTHPIQYQVPLWRALANDTEVPFEVWYLSDHGARPGRDREFGRTFAWDIELLEGYPHRFLGARPGAPVDRFWTTRLPRGARGAIRDTGLSALWIQGWQVRAYWQAASAAHAAGVPVWLRAESNDLRPESRARRALKGLILDRLLARVDSFLCIGSANRRLYARYGVASDRMLDAPYGVDNERFRDAGAALRPRREALRRAWGIPDDAYCMLFAGKFVDKKRPFDLIAAASRPELRDPDAPVHLLFAGSGPLGADLRAACNVRHDAEHPVATRRGEAATTKPSASFTGFLNQSEIAQAYVAADCLVLPSDHRETWGLVVNEAMACGLACVVSRACGCAEDLVAPIAAALCFETASPAALAASILAARRDPPSAVEIATVLERHSIARTVDTVARLHSLQALDRPSGVRAANVRPARRTSG